MSTQFVQLLGAESVQGAGHSMERAAERIGNAADHLESALDRFLREFTAQVDRIVDATDRAALAKAGEREGE